MEQSAEAARKVLLEISGLAEDDPLSKLIMQMYALFLEGETIGTMRHVAQRVKNGSMRDVI